MTEYILAIDPALSTTGYAVINRHTLELLCVGKITTLPKTPDDYRINEIVTKLFSIATNHSVTHVILEDGYIGANAKTAIQLATLRGAIIGVFSFNKYSVHHMLPSEIRKAVGVGGNAKKEEVAKAITSMYQNDEKLISVGSYSDKYNKNKTSDIYDAISIGVAFCKKVTAHENNE